MEEGFHFMIEFLHRLLVLEMIRLLREEIRIITGVWVLMIPQADIVLKCFILFLFHFVHQLD